MRGANCRSKTSVSCSIGTTRVAPRIPAVTIVTFSDFECNHCRDANIELKRIYGEHPDDIRIVFKNYPLDMACNENMTRPNFLALVQGGGHGPLRGRARSVLGDARRDLRVFPL